MTSIADAPWSHEDTLHFALSSLEDGLAIIRFLDGPHGPLSDYLHVEINPAFEQHSGLAGVQGKTLREVLPGEADGWVAQYREVLLTGVPLRFERRLEHNGRDLDLSAVRVGPFENRLVAVFFRDVSERRSAEERLRQLNETLEARVAAALKEKQALVEMVDAWGSYVLACDMDMRLVAVNRAAVAAFARGFGRTPVIGDNLLEGLAPGPDRDELERHWRVALGGKEVSEVQHIPSSPVTGGARYLEIRVSPMYDVSGQQVGAYELAYDVTERIEEQIRLRQTEEALRQAQKMEAVGQLTGGLAHDFNNLLAGIVGAFSMVSRRLRDGRLADAERYLTAGQEAAKRAGALTHRLLAFSRRQTLAPKALVVDRLVADLVELVVRTVGPQYDIAADVDARLWTVLVDANQLENALLNLCINARDAMPGGGPIRISASNRQLSAGEAHPLDLPAGDYVAISVRDTGTGIPADVVDRVFDPFFTTKPLGEGTGLGLSMVYGFARQSHGQVGIETGAGIGTTVTILLPRHRGRVRGDIKVNATEARAPGRGTLLVIDDEALVRMTFVDGLRDAGYTCLEAETGAAGLALLESDPTIDLLVTDVGLPGGLNGRQVADAALRLRPGLRVLFVTGYAEGAVVGPNGVPPGMEVLSKPFEIDTLVRRVGDLLKA